MVTRMPCSVRKATSSVVNVSTGDPFASTTSPVVGSMKNAPSLLAWFRSPSPQRT